MPNPEELGGVTAAVPAPTGPAAPPLVPVPPTTSVVRRGRASSALLASGAWLRGSRLGLGVIALVVGAGAGVGAAGFRWLIYAFTWLATGHDQFGQQGRVASVHLAWFGPYFVVVVPVIGGLLYSSGQAGPSSHAPALFLLTAIVIGAGCILTLRLPSPDGTT